MSNFLADYPTLRGETLEQWFEKVYADHARKGLGASFTDMMGGIQKFGYALEYAKKCVSTDDNHELTKLVDYLLDRARQCRDIVERYGR
jgi:hypothetical protein